MTLPNIWLLVIGVLLITPNALCQTADDCCDDKLTLTGDFRFRAEHDWNSMKADGTMRSDRSRLRYRLRFGFNYQYNEWASFGARVRTGNLKDQQGPHVTLGGNSGEFSLTQIGVEKAFFKASKNGFEGWIGKNTFPFMKQNELFWNDNVFPEGVAVKVPIPLQTAISEDLALKASHFVIRHNNQLFKDDAFMQGIQLTGLKVNRFQMAMAWYHFVNVPNIPDQQGTYLIDYDIFHLYLQYALPIKTPVTLGFDYYENFNDLQEVDSITTMFANQGSGYVGTIKVGQLKEKGDWAVHLYLAHIERYAIVDYFAQNDWARWDYSSENATGSALSNFKGFELRVGYAFGKKFNLIFRGYWTERLKSETAFKENGSRVRLDLNIGF